MHALGHMPILMRQLHESPMAANQLLACRVSAGLASHASREFSTTLDLVQVADVRHILQPINL